MTSVPKYLQARILRKKQVGPFYNILKPRAAGHPLGLGFRVSALGRPIEKVKNILGINCGGSTAAWDKEICFE